MGTENPNPCAPVTPSGAAPGKALHSRGALEGCIGHRSLGCARNDGRFRCFQVWLYRPALVAGQDLNLRPFYSFGFSACAFALHSSRARSFSNDPESIISFSARSYPSRYAPTSPVLSNSAVNPATLSAICPVIATSCALYCCMHAISASPVGPVKEALSSAKACPPPRVLRPKLQV
jgi:hypothetical protein